ncbi:MAG: UvrD-helicase domain-containing protein [Nitrospirota bacterium]
MEDLNPQQKEALDFTEGPLLVLAGAGSGKTRVIAHKFSHLVKSKKCYPDSILTLTFTNKAADEMRERISSLIGKNCDSHWIGTFHSQCSRVLRKEINALVGYDNKFSIMDEDGQCALIRHILKEFKMHEVIYKGFASRISFLKSSLVSPEKFLSSANGFGFDEKLAKVYVRYQDELIRSNALDFDDLIVLTIKLFENYPSLLKKYQDMFYYILIDEFQDTNFAQYYLIKLMGSGHNKVCAVGDDDQSIYKFRGANINNILNFEKDFYSAKVVKLEQNYRSTQHILNASDAVISKISARKHKRLWTDRGCGEKVHYCCFNTCEEEAKHIAKVIKALYLKGEYNHRDFAVFYRINIQSKHVEDALLEEGIPYRVFGGISFYHRKEIKDILAYARLSLNHRDNISFRRIINNPTRGISNSILSKIENEAKKKAVPLFEAARMATRGDVFASAIKDKLREFIKMIEGFSPIKYKTASEMFKDIIDKSGYIETIEEERIKNLLEIISSAEGKGIEEFLDMTSLYTNQDEITQGNYVSLMTLHSAKGLEFPVIFITGLEEGLLPYFKAMENDDDIAEERRLLYVGMTRAKDILWLTSARKRRLYAKIKEQEPSRFLKDIPRDCCHWIEKITVQHIIDLVPVKKRVETKNIFTLYTAGCKVKHPTWGVGVVRDCYGDEDNIRVMVNFPKFGIKKLSAKFANLEKI